ncbi:MAG: caspase family protein [Burkholderiales bacterium]|nr:caspase family protein [Burkholderiales bacterium]
MKYLWLITALLASQTAWSQQSSNRAALIIGIGQYSEASNTDTLHGVPVDMLNARRMAKEMGISNDNIVELRDSQATKENIQREFKKLAEKVKEGDRVFIYHSGHGTRYQQANNCLQGLQTYTTGKFTVADILTESEIAAFTKPISEKADKVVVMIDACFSGGVINPSTRSIGDRLNIRPKFNDNSSQSCENIGVNKINTRSLLSEIKRFGVHEEITMKSVGIPKKWGGLRPTP